MLRPDQVCKNPRLREQEAAKAAVAKVLEAVVLERAAPPAPAFVILAGSRAPGGVCVGRRLCGSASRILDKDTAQHLKRRDNVEEMLKKIEEKQLTSLKIPLQ